MFFAWFEILSWVGRLLKRKIILVRVNGAQGNNYEYLVQRWVTKLVCYKEVYEVYKFGNNVYLAVFTVHTGCPTKHDSW